MKLLYKSSWTFLLITTTTSMLWWSEALFITSTVHPTRMNMTFKHTTTSLAIASSITTNDVVSLQEQQQQESLSLPPFSCPPPQQDNDNKDPPKLGTIMRMLPKETFDIHTPTSLFYFGLDMIAVLTSMGFLYTVVTSDIYHMMSWWVQIMMVVPLQILTGFTMWCMWCIGHDAGHSVISSSSKTINRVVGEISHSIFCLTPFVPWAKSHQKHHLNHNHLTRDYSHQWFIRSGEEQEQEKHLSSRWLQWSYKTRNIQLPILYFVYLVLGIPDGGHVWFYGRMWEGSTWKEKGNAMISVMISIGTAATLWSMMGTADFTVVCMIPWCVMSFWLFMVTYLQHHSEDGKLYTDDTFTFEKGAFETVDRNYGTWINRLSHHMMDGHVVHHLFFEKVPHYRLERATQALMEGLEARGQRSLYKCLDTPNFIQEIIQQFHENWFFIHENQVVRKVNTTEKK